MARRKAIVHRYLEEPPASAGPRIVQSAIMVAILVSVATIVVGTINADGGAAVRSAGSPPVTLEERYPRIFRPIEWLVAAVFTVEYVLRLWSTTVVPRYRRPVLGRIRYAFTPMALIDLISVLPFYLEEAGAFGASGFLAARALRLVRVFRIFKLGHYSVAVRSLERALIAKRAELGVTVFVIAILLILASTLVYYAEVEAQPDRFSSIPATMWWGIVTLTTVGYGDIAPITPLGKIAGGIVAIFGIGLVALPAGILGSAFIEEIGARKEPRRCPHCGREIET